MMFNSFEIMKLLHLFGNTNKYRIQELIFNCVIFVFCTQLNCKKFKLNTILTFYNVPIGCRTMIH